MHWTTKSHYMNWMLLMYKERCYLFYWKFMSNLYLNKLHAHHEWNMNLGTFGSTIQDSSNSLHFLLRNTYFMYIQKYHCLDLSSNSTHTSSMENVFHCTAAGSNNEIPVCVTHNLVSMYPFLSSFLPELNTKLTLLWHWYQFSHKWSLIVLLTTHSFG